MKLTAWVLTVILIVSALTTAAFAWVLGTEAGTRWLIAEGTKRVDGLSIGETRGTAVGRLCAATVTWREPAQVITVSDVCLAVDVSSLFGSTLRLGIASAREVRIEALAEQAQEPSIGLVLPAIPVLPLRIELPRVTVGEVVLADGTAIRHISLAATGVRRSVAIAELELIANEHRLSAYGQVRWNASDPPVLRVDADYRVEGDDLEMRGTVAGTPADLRAAVVVSRPLGVRSRAQLDVTNGALPFEMSIDLPDSDLSRWAGRAVSASARVTARGDLAGFTFDLNAAFADAELGRGTVVGSGDGDPASVRALLDVSMESPTAGRGTARAKLGVDWSAALTWNADVQVDSLDVAPSEHLRVRVSGRLLASGTTEQASGSAMGVKGVLNEVPFELSGGFDASEGAVAVRDMNISVGAGRIVADVRVTPPTLAGVVHLDSLALAPLDARLSGVVNGDFEIGGTLDAPTAVGSLRATAPGFDGWVAEAISLRADTAAVPALVMQASGVANADLSVGDLQLEWGRLEPESNVALNWTGEAMGARMTADYAVAEDVVRAMVDVHELRLGPLGVWRGERAFGVSASLVQAGEVDVSDLCIAREDGARACGAVQYPRGGADVVLTGLAVRDWRPPSQGLSVSAIISASARFSSLDPDPLGAADIRVDDITVLPEEESDPEALGSLAGRIVLAPDGATVTIESEGDSVLLTSVALKAARLDASTPIEGRVHVRLRDLRLLDHVVPAELADVRGDFAMDLTITGRADAPEVTGTAHWREGSVLFTPTGVTLSGANLEVAVADPVWRAEAQASAGGPITLRATGSGGVADPLSGLVASVLLDNVRVLDLPEYQVWMSGTIDAVRDGEVLRITGTLDIPKAELAPKALPENTVSVSSDVVAVNTSASTGTQQIDLRLRLGNAVRFSAYGLDTRVVGELRLTETTDRVRQLRGTLDLQEGTFSNLGQTLRIERGRLIFSGSPENPALDVVAVRKVTAGGVDYVVSLHIEGTVRRLQTRVSADPAVPEADALALLVSGRRLSQMGKSETIDLAAAAQVLGVKAASQLTGRISGALGVDEVIVSGGSDKLEIGAGTRLGENLYLRYTYDIFSRLGGLLLSYQLTESLSIQAKSGDAQSIRLQYAIDR